MANNYRYAKEWTPWTEESPQATDVNDAAFFVPGEPFDCGGSSTNKPSGMQFGMVQTIAYDDPDDTNDGVYQIAVFGNSNNYRTRERSGTEGSYSWGTWLNSGAKWSWASATSLDDIPDGESRAVKRSDLDSVSPPIPAPSALSTGFGNSRFGLVWNNVAANEMRLNTVNTTSTYNWRSMYWQPPVPAVGYSFGFRDIVAVGFEDASDTKWLAAGTNTIARVHYVGGSGISLSVQGDPVDGFSYGKVFESRILRDTTPELQVSCYLTDSADTPPDNMISGQRKMIEIGMRNPDGQRQLVQMWGCRATSIERSMPDSEFGFNTYTYRMQDFRFEVPAAAQIISW